MAGIKIFKGDPAWWSVLSVLISRQYGGGAQKGFAGAFTYKELAYAL